MKENLEDKKRFAYSLGISVAIHIVLIIFLGIWSLKIPSSPELPSPVLVTLEPSEAVSEAPPAKEEDKPAEKERAEAQPVVKKTEKIAAPRRSASLSSVSSPKSTPSEPAPVPYAEEEAPVNQAGVSSGTEGETVSTVTSGENKPLPKPKGSRIVFADETGETEKQEASLGKKDDKSGNVVSGSEIDELASLLDSAPENTSGTVTDNTESSSSREQNDSLVPDNVSLSLEDSSSDRRPLSRLDLNIPKDILSRMDKDSSITVVFTLSPEGLIMPQSVIHSSVDAEVETLVLEALRHWSFSPDPGTDKNVTGQITIEFKVR